MRKLPFLLAAFLLIGILSSFTFYPLGKSNYKISVNGINHDLQDGLKPSEFAKMTIEVQDKSLKVESFEITLARGSRAISSSVIEGNTFDLSQYKSDARSGDRIVIEVSSQNTDALSPSKSIFVLKVN